MFFATYWAVGGIISLTDFIPSLPETTKQTIGAVYNMLDVPTVLAILYYTSTSLMLRKFTSVAFVFYMIMQIFSVVIKGVNYNALKYTLGSGIALVLIVLTWEIVRYLQKVEHNNRQNAKVLIYAALLFEYATFILVYVFDYFTDKQFYELQKKDIHLIYYISTLVGIIIACCGYLLYKKYKKEEPLRNEINIDII